ncbi:MAG TPA: YihY/virulence factor BrkB family protein [Rhizobiaceae bacterium]|nr:YihY/virulence factor BrkB family protein [Rhizobiaceae bacterium]
MNDDDAARGRNAHSPSQMTWRGWRDVLWRVWREADADRLMLIAAGTTYYLLLALFPALAAFVSLYGFFADPATISGHLSYLAGLLPEDGIKIIRDQLNALTAKSERTLSLSFLVAFAIAFWSANSGIKALFEAMNIVYDEREKRGFITLNLVAVLYTLGAMAVGLVLITAIGIVPAVLALVNLGGEADLVIRLARWPLIVVLIAVGISLIYRYGPSRERAKWRWVTWGGALATVAWLVVSIGFSFYLENFAQYNVTYGSLGAVVGFMIWTWLSVLVLLIGGELNSELEHQTAVDSTTGPPQPMGQRGAVMADTLGDPAD